MILRMTEAHRIADELSRSLRGPAWHGDALLELLSGVTAEEAAAQTSVAAHSIQEIVLHVISWQEIARAGLAGKPLPELPFPEDWPPAEGVAWTEALQNLASSGEGLATAAGVLDESDLAATVRGRDYSVSFLLHGVAQHNAYHGGQIALIKKALRAQPRTS
jgi:hypothetical protein